MSRKSNLPPTLRTPTPQFLVEDSTSPGRYLSLVGRQHSYTREIPHAMRFSSLEAEVAEWLLPHERFISLETALQSLSR